MKSHAFSVGPVRAMPTMNQTETVWKKSQKRGRDVGNMFFVFTTLEFAIERNLLMCAAVVAQ